MSNDELIARSITLVDDAGNPRIRLCGGNADGRCSIVLDSPETGGVEISAGLGARAGIAFSSPKLVGALSITSDGLALRSNDGRLAVVLGRTFDGRDDLIVFREGQISWRSTNVLS